MLRPQQPFYKASAASCCVTCLPQTWPASLHCATMVVLSGLMGDDNTSAIARVGFNFRGCQAREPL